MQDHERQVYLSPLAPAPDKLYGPGLPKSCLMKRTQAKVSQHEVVSFTRLRCPPDPKPVQGE